MTDAPLMVKDSPVKTLEIAAMTAYRAAHPDGPPWQDLHNNTRMIWMREAEQAAKLATGR